MSTPKNKPSKKVENNSKVEGTSTQIATNINSNISNSTLSQKNQNSSFSKSLNSTSKSGVNFTPFFEKENMKWMAIGLIILVLGFILMIGGKSSDPHVFETDKIYSFQRIILSPILIIVGFIIEGYAIMKKSK